MPSNDDKLKHSRVWPGMPMRRSQMFESFVMLLPLWIILLSILLTFLMPLIPSCRHAIHGGDPPAAGDGR